MAQKATHAGHETELSEAELERVRLPQKENNNIKKKKKKTNKYRNTGINGIIRDTLKQSTVIT